jgi:hypothetical protein
MEQHGPPASAATVGTEAERVSDVLEPADL